METHFQISIAQHSLHMETGTLSAAEFSVDAEAAAPAGRPSGPPPRRPPRPRRDGRVALRASAPPATSALPTSSTDPTDPASTDGPEYSAGDFAARGFRHHVVALAFADGTAPIPAVVRPILCFEE